MYTNGNLLPSANEAQIVGMLRQISEQDYMYYLHMQLCILAHPVPSTSLQSNVVCVLVRFVSPAKIAEPTEMQFGV